MSEDSDNMRCPGPQGKGIASAGNATAADTIRSDYFTPQQLAEGIGISLRTLLRWQQLRIAPPRTCVGGKRLYRKSAVEAWLRAREEPEVRKGRRA